MSPNILNCIFDNMRSILLLYSINSKIYRGFADGLAVSWKVINSGCLILGMTNRGESGLLGLLYSFFIYQPYLNCDESIFTEHPVCRVRVTEEPTVVT